MKRGVTTNVSLEMARARKALSAARTLLEHSLPEDSVSRAYYAVLHAAKAALATVDIFPCSHRGVRRMFSLHLVKPGSVEREYAVILTAGQEDRELSDYDIEIPIGMARAERRCQDAERFVERMSRLTEALQSMP